MTKSEAIKQLKNQVAPKGRQASMEAVSMAITALDDTPKQQKYQERECVAKIKENLLMIYEGMTNEEQRAWELGETFNQIENLLNSGDNK